MVREVRSQTLYERDFNLWLEDTAMLLRARKLSQVDLENLIEEIESMGRNEKNALKSNLRILLMHLLKYRINPSKGRIAGVIRFANTVSVLRICWTPARV